MRDDQFHRPAEHRRTRLREGEAGSLAGASSRTAVFANVFGYETSDYVEVARILEDHKGVAAYELNVSCPNTKHGGIYFSSDPALLTEVRDNGGETRRQTAGNRQAFAGECGGADRISLARAAEDAGADAISLVNTHSSRSPSMPRRGAAKHSVRWDWEACRRSRDQTDRCCAWYLVQVARWRGKDTGDLAWAALPPARTRRSLLIAGASADASGDGDVPAGIPVQPLAREPKSWAGFCGEEKIASVKELMGTLRRLLAEQPCGWLWRSDVKTVPAPARTIDVEALHHCPVVIWSRTGHARRGHDHQEYSAAHLVRGDRRAELLARLA